MIDPKKFGVTVATNIGFVCDVFHFGRASLSLASNRKVKRDMEQELYSEPDA